MDSYNNFITNKGAETMLTAYTTEFKVNTICHYEKWIRIIIKNAIYKRKLADYF